MAWKSGSDLPTAATQQQVRATLLVSGAMAGRGQGVERWGRETATKPWDYGKETGRGIWKLRGRRGRAAALTGTVGALAAGSGALSPESRAGAECRRSRRRARKGGYGGREWEMQEVDTERERIGEKKRHEASTHKRTREHRNR